MRKAFRLGLSALALAAMSMPASALTLSGTYYEDSADATCTAGQACTFNFAQFPAATAGKFIIIEFVSCGMLTYSTWDYAAFWISDAGANLRRKQYISTTRSSGLQSIMQQVKIKISGGPPRQPVIKTSVVSNSDGHQGTCTIVGTVTSE